MGGCGALRKLVDIFNGFGDDAADCSPKTGAENRIDNYIGAGDFRPRRIPGRFVANGDYIVAGFAPALQVDRSITVQLFGFREQVDFDDGLGHLHVPRYYQTISAVISLSTKHGDSAWMAFGSVDNLVTRFRDVAASGFHELQAGNAVALRGQAVNFAHFGSSENFHGRFAMSYSIQPPLTFTTWPVTYSASSEAKNDTVAATSSAVGGLPMGNRASRMRRASLSVNSFSSMLEGFTTLTVMPFFASSRASERDSATTAALAAAYAEIFA